MSAVRSILATFCQSGISRRAGSPELSQHPAQSLQDSGGICQESVVMSTVTLVCGLAMGLNVAASVQSMNVLRDDFSLALTTV